MSQLQPNPETTFSNPTDLHLQKVWAKIEAMTPGKRLIVKDEAPRFPELWISCAKKFMDCYKNVVEFSSDYSILRKL